MWDAWTLGREWTAEDGQLWVQYVSSTPATRLDVITLQEELDRKLQQRQARETGICPVREELYSQTFDELIRQVIGGPCRRRGLRVRAAGRRGVQRARGVALPPSGAGAAGLPRSHACQQTAPRR